MLLLAASANAKMRTAWRNARRAIVEATLHLSARVLAFVFRQRNFCSFCWQQTCYKQSLTIVMCHPLTKRVKVCGFNSNDLTRRHASFCRVELRHRRDFSHINIIILIVP